MVVGLGATEYTIDAIDIMQNGKTIRGSIQGDADPLEMVPRLLEMYSAGQLPLEPLIRTYDFTEIEIAVADVECGRTRPRADRWSGDHDRAGRQEHDDIRRVIRSRGA